MCRSIQWAVSEARGRIQLEGYDVFISTEINFIEQLLVESLITKFIKIPLR